MFKENNLTEAEKVTIKYTAKIREIETYSKFLDWLTKEAKTERNYKNV